MAIAPAVPNLESPFGSLRIWRWRGWRVRYTFLPAATPEAAQNSPILLLHGFGASLQQWRSNLVALSQYHPVYAIDLIGFGGSQKAAIAFSTDLWVEQIYDFWQAFIGQPIILLGHSLGALVALTAAVKHPEMAERLVMLTLPAARQELLSGCAGAIASRIETWFSSSLLTRLIFKIFRQPSVIRKTLQNLYQVAERVDDEIVEQFVAPTGDRGAARTLCYLVQSRTDPAFSAATQQMIPQLQMPTLLLWGTSDRVIPLTWGQKVAPLSDRVTLVEIPDAGHYLYDEYPDEINQRILNWQSTLIIAQQDLIDVSSS
ncbi:MAG: alpha/beta fold hydrolase [Cyanobacteria bacterium P01_D01_bin.128]